MNDLTPSQLRLYRAIEGAVKNAAHAHPDWKLDKTIARSIAKRAAGTLRAQWPEVLAARLRPSDGGGGGYGTVPRGPLDAGAAIHPRSTRRAPRPEGRRSPLIQLWRKVALLCGDAKRTGRPERAAALVEVLRLVAAMQRQP